MTTTTTMVTGPIERVVLIDPMIPECSVLEMKPKIE